MQRNCDGHEKHVKTVKAEYVVTTEKRSQAHGKKWNHTSTSSHGLRLIIPADNLQVMAGCISPWREGSGAIEAMNSVMGIARISYNGRCILSVKGRGGKERKKKEGERRRGGGWGDRKRV